MILLELLLAHASFIILTENDICCIKWLHTQSNILHIQKLIILTVVMKPMKIKELLCYYYKIISFVTIFF